jgi:hypothetical protein
VERHESTLERSRTRDVLLCNGTDHAPIQPDIGDRGGRDRLAHPELPVSVTGYPQYVMSVRQHLPAELPFIKAR